ncbi:MAG: sigma-70 family RNA polymerase sigma factor [Demequinaceae bacterium]|nr:sigma-70 family RNA polymerase sigma factor [Demequinaceae bacterium]
MADWRNTMECLVRDRERALLGYAYLVCGDSTEAQDLVQDALVRTFSRPRPGLTVFKAEAYVRRAITSTYIDQYRRHQRWSRVQHLFRPGDGGDDATLGVDMSADVTLAISSLPPRERACILLRFFDDLTVPQIGRQLGIAEGSVKRYLSDGIERLERSLGPLEDTEIETTPVAGYR